MKRTIVHNLSLFCLGDANKSLGPIKLRNKLLSEADSARPCANCGCPATSLYVCMQVAQLCCYHEDLIKASQVPCLYPPPPAAPAEEVVTRGSLDLQASKISELQKGSYSPKGTVPKE